MNKDIKYLGVPNVCFSLTNKDDEREEDYKQQRVERGFDDSETWSLDMTIARFIIPRLERYIEISKEIFADTDVNNTHIKDCNLFLNSMKCVANNEQLTKDKEIQEGLDVFPTLFKALWW